MNIIICPHAICLHGWGVILQPATQDIFVIFLGRFHLLCPCEWYRPASKAVDSVTALTKTRKTKTRVPDSIGAPFQLVQCQSLYMSCHPPNWQTQCGSVIHPLLDLSGPFKTKQWSAVIVPSAQQHPAESLASCLHLCQPPASLTRFFWSPAASVTSFQGAPQIIFSPFSFQFGKVGSYMSESGFVGLKMSVKRRLLSMLLCCVYCVASLFCLHPNRNNCVTGGARWVSVRPFINIKRFLLCV